MAYSRHELKRYRGGRHCPNFSRLHVVFWKFRQNHILATAHPPTRVGPPLRRILDRPLENFCLPHRWVRAYNEFWFSGSHSVDNTCGVTSICVGDMCSCDIVNLDDGIGTTVYCSHRVVYFVTDYHTFTCQNYVKLDLQYMQLNCVLAVRECLYCSMQYCALYIQMISPNFTLSFVMSIILLLITISSRLLIRSA